MAQFSVPVNIRLPRDLMDKIQAQMKADRRASRSEMIRILIEDGLKLREEQHKREEPVE